jgi:hypothetical protein
VTAPPIYDAPPLEGNWTDQLPLPISWGSKQQWTYFSAEIQPLKHWNKDHVEIVFDIDEQYLERPEDDAFAAGPEGQVSAMQCVMKNFNTCSNQHVF